MRPPSLSDKAQAVCLSRLSLLDPPAPLAGIAHASLDTYFAAFWSAASAAATPSAYAGSIRRKCSI